MNSGVTDLIEHTKNMQDKLLQWQRRKKLFAAEVNNYLLHVQGHAKTPEEANRKKVQAFKHLEMKKKCDSKINMLENAIHNNQKIISLAQPKDGEVNGNNPAPLHAFDAQTIQSNLKKINTSQKNHRAANPDGILEKLKNIFKKS